MAQELISFNPALMSLPLQADPRMLSRCDCRGETQAWDIDQRALVRIPQRWQPGLFFLRKAGTDSAKFVVRIYDATNKTLVKSLASGQLIVDTYRQTPAKVGDQGWDYVILQAGPNLSVDLNTGVYYLMVAGLISEPFQVVTYQENDSVPGFDELLFELAHPNNLATIPYQTGYTQRFGLKGSLCAGEPRIFSDIEKSERFGDRIIYQRQFRVWTVSWQEVTQPLSELLASLSMHGTVKIRDSHKQFELTGTNCKVTVKDESCCSLSVTLEIEETLNEWADCDTSAPLTKQVLDKADPSYVDPADADNTSTPYKPVAAGSLPAGPVVLPAKDTLLGESTETRPCSDPFIDGALTYSTKKTIRRADGKGGEIPEVVYQGICEISSPGIRLPIISILPDILSRVGQFIRVPVIDETKLKSSSSSGSARVSAEGLPEGLSYSGGSIIGTPKTAGATEAFLKVTEPGGGSVSLPLSINAAPSAPTLLDTNVAIKTTYNASDKKLTATVTAPFQPEIKLAGDTNFVKATSTGTKDTYTTTFTGVAPTDSVQMSVRQSGTTGTGITFPVPVAQTPGVTLETLLANPSVAAQALFCKMVANCSGTTPTDPESTFDVVHYVFIDDTTTTVPTPTPKAPRYVVHVDKISCDIITGWGADWNNLDSPITVAIKFDGVVVATITVTNPRTDVAGYLKKNADADEVSKVDNDNLYGWEWIVPAKYRVGKSYEVTVFANGTTVEAEVYNSPKATGTCGTVPGGSTPTPTPYIIQTVMDGPPALYESGDELVWTLRDRYNTDTDETRTGGVDRWEILEGKPDGLVMTPFDNNSKMRMKLNDLDFTKKRTLRATLTGGGYAENLVQLIDTSCHRPDGQVYQAQLIYAFAPVSGGDARAFTSLEDACLVMGRHFDGTERVLFTPFKAEMANYNKGTTTYLNWSNTDTSCATTDDRIFYVLNGDLQNGQKIAIQVAGGKIAGSLNNSYTTPAPTNPTPSPEPDPEPEPDTQELPAILEVSIAYYSAFSKQIGWIRDVMVFVKNGRSSGKTEDVPVSGWKNVTDNSRDTTGRLAGFYVFGNLYSDDNSFDSILRQAQQQGYKYWAFSDEDGYKVIGKPGQTVRVRVKANALVNAYKEFDFVIPADGTIQNPQKIFPV